MSIYKYRGNVHANEQVIAVEDNNPLIIYISEDVINQKKNFSKSVVDFENENNIDTRALVSKTTLVSTNIAKETKIEWAWIDGRNNANVSLNFGYGPISVSISNGNVGNGSSAMC